MKRLFAVVFTVALGAGLGGCASSGSMHAPTLASASGRGFYASGPVPQDPNPRGTTVLATPERDADGARAGIPTPEPAVPHHEVQLAGPVPQIPIPGRGRPID